MSEAVVDVSVVRTTTTATTITKPKSYTSNPTDQQQQLQRKNERVKPAAINNKPQAQLNGSSNLKPH